MRGILGFTEQFFWTMVWIFIALIAGFYLLSLLRNVDGPIGNAANWVSSHAESQA